MEDVAWSKMDENMIEYEAQMEEYMDKFLLRMDHMMSSMNDQFHAINNTIVALNMRFDDLDQKLSAATSHSSFGCTNDPSASPYRAIAHLVSSSTISEKASQRHVQNVMFYETQQLINEQFALLKEDMLALHQEDLSALHQTDDRACGQFPNPPTSYTSPDFLISELASFKFSENNFVEQIWEDEHVLEINDNSDFSPVSNHSMGMHIDHMKDLEIFHYVQKILNAISNVHPSIGPITRDRSTIFSYAFKNIELNKSMAFGNTIDDQILLHNQLMLSSSASRNEMVAAMFYTFQGSPQKEKRLCLSFLTSNLV